MIPCDTCRFYVDDNPPCVHFCRERWPDWIDHFKKMYTGISVKCDLYMKKLTDEEERALLDIAAAKRNGEKADSIDEGGKE